MREENKVRPQTVALYRRLLKPITDYNISEIRFLQALE